MSKNEGVSPSGPGLRSFGPEPQAAQPEALVPCAGGIWLFTDQIAGTLAMWAIRQSPYPCPDNLEIVVRKFSELWPADALDMSRWPYLDALLAKIEEVSLQIPEMLAWNDRKNGRLGMGFSSRFDQPEPDDDFIDLQALWMNTARSLWHEEEDAQGTSASGQDAKRLEAKPAGPVTEGDAPTIAPTIETLQSQLTSLTEALEKIFDAIGKGRMIERGAGGMSIDAQVRRSVYVDVPAFPIEEARSAYLQALSNIRELAGE